MSQMWYYTDMSVNEYPRRGITSCCRVVALQKASHDTGLSHNRIRKSLTMWRCQRQISWVSTARCCAVFGPEIAAWNHKPLAIFHHPLALCVICLELAIARCLGSAMAIANCRNRTIQCTKVWRIKVMVSQYGADMFKGVWWTKPTECVVLLREDSALTPPPPHTRTHTIIQSYWAWMLSLIFRCLNQRSVCGKSPPPPIRFNLVKSPWKLTENTEQKISPKFLAWHFSKSGTSRPKSRDIPATPCLTEKAACISFLSRISRHLGPWCPRHILPQNFILGCFFLPDKNYRHG